MNYNLKDKVCLITGGSRGIGFDIARTLLCESAKVIICGRKPENLEKAAEQLGSENLTCITTHIADTEQVDQMFEQIKNDFGCLDILFNNVGMNLMTPQIAELSPELWQKIIDTNLTGTFLVSRKAAAMMVDKKQGKIVTISSVAARKATPGMGIYGVAKAGIEMLTKVLASELAPHNIQVNAVAPGMVKTDFSKPFWSNSELLSYITKDIPAGRIAEPMEVVHPALFLASEGAGYITGETLVVDGGSMAV